MHFSILGPLTAVHDGETVALGGIRQRTALAFLVLHANTPVGTTRLVSALWEADEPATARKILQNAVSGLRRIRAGRSPQEAPLIDLRTEPRGYVLHVAADRVDHTRHRELVRRAAAASADRSWEHASVILRKAQALWRGDALADLAEAGVDWPELAALREARWSALEDRVVADLMLGRHREVVAELGAATAAGPTRERLCRLHMVALYRSGRQAEALDVYRRARTALAEHGPAAPGARSHALERAVLSHAPELDEADAVLRLAA
ncbi:BTAD domain-containing putative transcriptional regulator [Kitasatospora sp. NPDC089509]|uniref:AfsR/SARP family transcriptional regulator n=1 Tax=Kitasatospora sp. NPDC089509 TaxID=3364079 RepID=UPI0037F5A7C2